MGLAIIDILSYCGKDRGVGSMGAMGAWAPITCTECCHWDKV